MADKMDEVQVKVDQIVRVVESARAMPLSASCVVNRDELLGLLRDLRTLVPQSLRQAQRVLRDAEEVVAEAQEQADAILEEAQAERAEMLTDTAVYAEGVRVADRMAQEAAAQSESMRAEVDDYVDAKLANFEIVLTKTLASVARGRQKLAGRNEFGEFDDADETRFPG